MTYTQTYDQLYATSLTREHTNRHVATGSP